MDVQYYEGVDAISRQCGDLPGTSEAVRYPALGG